MACNNRYKFATCDHRDGQTRTLPSHRVVIDRQIIVTGLEAIRQVYFFTSAEVSDLIIGLGATKVTSRSLESIARRDLCQGTD